MEQWEDFEGGKKIELSNRGVIGGGVETFSVVLLKKGVSVTLAPIRRMRSWIKMGQSMAAWDCRRPVDSKLMAVKNQDYARLSVEHECKK